MVSVFWSDFELLNAYVDGELSATEAAKVAARIAAEPNLASAAAELWALKAAHTVRLTGEDIPPFPCTLRRRLGPTPKARLAIPPRTRFSRASVLATILAFVIGATVTQIVGRGSMSGAEEIAPDALALHNWAEQSEDALALVREDFEPRHVVIMRSAGLRPYRARRIPLSDGTQARQESYVGPNGCRISLFVLKDTEQPIRFPEVADVLFASWSAPRTRMYLLARSLDPMRFASIVNALRTYEDDTPSEELLASSEYRSLPCA